MQASAVALFVSGWMIAANSIGHADAKEPSRPTDEIAAVDATLSIEQLKPQSAPGERVGYKRKRFVGGPLQVIPEAVMQSQVEAEGVLSESDAMRAFVVLGPKGYSWRFMYDRKLGVPEFEHAVGDDPRKEFVEVMAPEGLAFEAGEVSLKNALTCRNIGTCNVCHCCMLCVCGAGNYCDSDWTGYYESLTRLEERHTVNLLPQD